MSELMSHKKSWFKENQLCEMRQTENSTSDFLTLPGSQCHLRIVVGSHDVGHCLVVLC